MPPFYFCMWHNLFYVVFVSSDTESTEKQGRGMRKKKKKTFGDDEDGEEESEDDGIDDGITYEVIEGGSQRGKKKLISSEGYTFNVKVRIYIE